METPTLSFLCVVNHNNQIMVCSDAYCGAANDEQKKVVSKIHALFSGLLEDVQYKLYNAEGTRQWCKVLISLQTAAFCSWVVWWIPVTSAILWNIHVGANFLSLFKKMLSARLAFLKFVYRILLYPSELHSFDDISNVFKCCSILHNIILAYYDREHLRECQLWENVDWSVLNPEDLSEDVVDAMLEEAQRNLDI